MQHFSVIARHYGGGFLKKRGMVTPNRNENSHSPYKSSGSMKLATFVKLLGAFVSGMCCLCLLFTFLYTADPLSRYSSGYSLSLSPSYLLSLSYYDQLTWGAIRVRSLQCWAKRSMRYLKTARIVAPFVTESHLRFPVGVLSTDLKDNLGFGNVFDLDVWNTVGREYDFSPVVDWNNFLQRAPRNVVLVQMVYVPNKLCPEDPFTDATCNPERLRTLWSNVLEPHNFTIQREVCVDFPKEGFITVEILNKLIFGDAPSSTPFTMIFDEWRGNYNMMKCFIPLYDMTYCSPIDPKLMNMTKHSLSLAPKIVKTAEKYMGKYLSRTAGYTAILIRWEKVLLYDFYYKNTSRFLGTTCVGLIEDYLERMYKERQLDIIFLATDIGKYGSSTFHLYDAPREGLRNVTRYTNELLRYMYGKTMTWNDYEAMFEAVSESTDPAIISQVQKAVAARAKCLLMVGWGTFHEHTLQLYKELHTENVCYKVITAC